MQSNFASRPAASALLDAVEKGAVSRQDISPFVARQIQALKNPQVSQKLEKVWGVIRPASKERAALTAKYKAILTAESLKKADLSKGKTAFAKNCASCHKLYGEGGAIGPELTGSQRNNLDYILENVIDPSAVVAREYTVTNIDLKNGRTVSGIIAEESERALTVQTPNEKLIIAKSDIETRTQTNVSMMPEGLFDKSEDELASGGIPDALIGRRSLAGNGFLLGRAFLGLRAADFMYTFVRTDLWPAQLPHFYRVDCVVL